MSDNKLRETVLFEDIAVEYKDNKTINEMRTRLEDGTQSKEFKRLLKAVDAMGIGGDLLW